jgi:rSAM/selenodomain-associated transferase 1
VKPPPCKLLLMAKEPAPGRVKTRIARQIGPEAAAALAWALLEDAARGAADGAAAAGAILEVVHAPDAPSTALVERVAAAAPGSRLRAQGLGDLGVRLARALADVAWARVAIGSDAPDLPPERFAQAFAALARSPAVVGPALDGGYYLLGLAPGVPPGALEVGIRWSTPHALADTRAALRAAGIGPIFELPPHGDVDEPEDLARLAELLARDPSRAPATARWTAAWRDEQRANR